MSPRAAGRSRFHGNRPPRHARLSPPPLPAARSPRARRAPAPAMLPGTSGAGGRREGAPALLHRPPPPPPQHSLQPPGGPRRGYGAPPRGRGTGGSYLWG